MIESNTSKLLSKSGSGDQLLVTNRMQAPIEMPQKGEGDCDVSRGDQSPF